MGKAAVRQGGSEQACPSLPASRPGCPWSSIGNKDPVFHAEPRVSLTRGSSWSGQVALTKGGWRSEVCGSANTVIYGQTFRDRGNPTADIQPAAPPSRACRKWTLLPGDGSLVTGFIRRDPMRMLFAPGPPNPAFFSITLTILCSLASRGADVSFYGVDKAEKYNQGSAGPPTLGSGNPCRFGDL